MREEETENVATIEAYLAALAEGAGSEVLRRFFTDDALQVELPNRLNPQGGQSDLETLLQRAEQGRKLLRSQTYEVRSVLARGDRVAVEASWTGTLAVPLGTLEAGAAMRAHFAMFFELESKRIRRQRNYDCFEPW